MIYENIYSGYCIILHSHSGLSAFSSSSSFFNFQLLCHRSFRYRILAIFAIFYYTFFAFSFFGIVILTIIIFILLCPLSCVIWQILLCGVCALVCLFVCVPAPYVCVNNKNVSVLVSRFLLLLLYVCVCVCCYCI